MACQQDSVKVTPIMFSVPLEDSDEEEDGDTDHADSAGFSFGASLQTKKILTEESTRRFVHKFVNMVPNHEALKNLKEDDELYSVNDHNVTGWNHELLIKILQDLSEEIKLVFYRESIHFTGEDEVIKKEYITITFTLCGLEGDAKGILDDITSRIKSVVVSFTTDTTTIKVSCLEYTDTKTNLIKHSPTQQFLVVDEKDRPVVKKLGSECASRFNVLYYSIMEELDDRRDGTEENFANVVVAVQCKTSNKFLMCSKGSRKVSLVEDEDITPEMRDVKPNAPCLFLLWRGGDGRSFFIQSMAYPDYFLAYDHVRLLRVQDMDPPPYSDKFKETDSVRRNFTFEIM